MRSLTHVPVSADHALALQAVSVKFVAAQLYIKASEHKNPKVLQEAVTWLTTTGTEFGVQALDPKWASTTSIAVLQHTNAGVRSAGNDFAAVLYQALGEGYEEKLAGALKPAAMSTVRERFAKAEAPPPQPTRQERKATPSTSAGRAAAPASPATRAAGDSSMLFAYGI